MLPNESVPSRLDVRLDPPGDVRWSCASTTPPLAAFTSSAYKPSEYKQPPLSRQENRSFHSFFGFTAKRAGTI